MAGNKDLITAQALADALDLSVETIWRYTREKRIPYVELGRKQYRYNYEDVVTTLKGTAVREKEADYNADPDKLYTYQDYLGLKEEPGYRYEVLNGILIKDSSPGVDHQRVVSRLNEILLVYFRQTDVAGEVLFAPLDVTFQDDTVVQPDLFYISGDQKEIVKKARIDGAPKLVVEVLSPHSGRKDRLKKMNIYQKAGVEHFWIANPEDKTLECFSLKNGLYSIVASGMERDIVVHPDFDGLTIELDKLWPRE